MLWRTRLNPVPGRKVPMATRGVGWPPIPPAPIGPLSPNPLSPDISGKGDFVSPLPTLGEGLGVGATVASAGERVDGGVGGLAVDGDGHELHGEGGVVVGGE